jgi:hypothetical protein
MDVGLRSWGPSLKVATLRKETGKEKYIFHKKREISILTMKKKQQG